jgi:tetratricopeptide (TPR) repeat protein
MTNQKSQNVEAGGPQRGSSRLNLPSAINDSRIALIICLLLGGVTLTAYWPVQQCDFVSFDDPYYVTDNPQVRAGLTWRGMAWALRTTETREWHPLTWYSHMLDCQWFGLNAGAHHRTNLLFHVANTLLLFGILRRLTQTRWRSAFVAALFALHPSRVESVAWVAERKDVLSTFFFMLTLWAYARYAQGSARCQVSGVRIEVSRRFPSSIFHPSSRFYLLSLLCFALGLMSKPMVVTLPFVLLLLDYWPLGRFQPSSFNFELPTLRRLIFEKLPFFLLSAAGSLIAFRTAHRGAALFSTDEISITGRIANALISYFRYIRKMISPDDLAVFYPHPGTWPLWQVIGAGLFLTAVSILVLVSARRRPYLLLGWLWFLGMLVPVIGLVQAGLQSMADRFAYVPLVGLFIMITWGAYDWAWQPGSRRRAVLVVAALGALIGSALATRLQVAYWKNGETLFSHALAVTRHNFIAHEHLGLALAKKGDLVTARRHWEETLRIKPDSYIASYNLGLLCALEGKRSEAVAHYSAAVRVKPDYADALNNMAWILATPPDAQFRDGQSAVSYAARAVTLTRTNDAAKLDTLAAAYAGSGRFAEAVQTAREAQELAEAAGNKPLADGIRGRLALYQSGQAYHE